MDAGDARLAPWASRLDELEDVDDPIDRLLAEVGRAEEALTLLESLTRSARAAGHVGAAIGALVLTAITRQGMPAGPALRLVAAQAEGVPPGWPWPLAGTSARDAWNCDAVRSSGSS